MTTLGVRAFDILGGGQGVTLAQLGHGTEVEIEAGSLVREECFLEGELPCLYPPMGGHVEIHV